MNLTVVRDGIVARSALAWRVTLTVVRDGIARTYDYLVVHGPASKRCLNGRNCVARAAGPVLSLIS